MIRNPSFSFFPNDDQFYQNMSASNPFSSNNCTVRFHMDNQVQNVSSSVDNLRKRRRIIYSSDSSQEKWIIKKNGSLCFLLKTDPCKWIIKFLMNMFCWCWVMVLQSVRKFCCWFQKKTYLWKLLLVNMSCSVSTLGFVDWVKAFKLVIVFSIIFLSF